ncbi:hypothetical protein ACHAW6_008082 [Cyclotella cf. meneghiniana]
MTIEISNGAAQTSVSRHTEDLTNYSYIKLQRVDQIAREREEYAERVKLLEQELDRCKIEMKELKGLSNVACKRHSTYNQSVTAKNEDDSRNVTISADTVDTNIRSANTLAKKEIKKSNSEENCEEEDSAAELNNENCPFAKEIPDINNEGKGIKKFSDESAAMIASLTHKLSEVIHERDELKMLVHELRCQNDDYRKVYGSLDDFTDLRHQYESLLQEEYNFVNNVAYADVMSGNGSERTYSIRSQQNKRDIDRIYHDLNQFMASIKLRSSTPGK